MFLLFATGINSRGEIVGFGLTSTFDAHAFWRPRATAKTTARPLRLPHKAGPVKAGRSLSLKMFASCFSSDCPSAGSEPGSWGLLFSGMSAVTGVLGDTWELVERTVSAPGPLLPE